MFLPTEGMTGKYTAATVGDEFRTRRGARALPVTDAHVVVQIRLNYSIP